MKETTQQSQRLLKVIAICAGCIGMSIANSPKTLTCTTTTQQSPTSSSYIDDVGNL